jgi:hypothetical protein
LIQRHSVPQTIAVLKAYLDLSPEQVQNLIEILREYHEVFAALHEEVKENERALREAVMNDDVEGAGVAAIQIHELRRTIRAEEQARQSQIEALLDEDQYGRLEWARKVAAAKFAIPAFRNVGLLRPLPEDPLMEQ